VRRAKISRPGKAPGVMRELNRRDVSCQTVCRRIRRARLAKFPWAAATSLHAHTVSESAPARVADPAAPNSFRYANRQCRTPPRWIRHDPWLLPQLRGRLPLSEQRPVVRSNQRLTYEFTILITRAARFVNRRDDRLRRGEQRWPNVGTTVGVPAALMALRPRVSRMRRPWTPHSRRPLERAPLRSSPEAAATHARRRSAGGLTVPRSNVLVSLPCKCSVTRSQIRSSSGRAKIAL
jgi:hypothetical protein